METIILDDRNVKIDIKQENYAYSSLYNSYKPDPAWCYQDANGHIHRWDLAAKKVHTIKTVIDAVHDHYDDGDHWTTEETHEECILCGEHIEPGYLIDVPAGQMQYIPTAKSFSGSYSPKDGEYWPKIEETHHFKMNIYEFDAIITGFDIEMHKAPVFHFSGIGKMVGS